MVEQERIPLRKRRYIAAFIITLLIFTLGFLAGLVLEAQRTDYLASTYNEQRVEYGSIQLQYQLIEEISRDADCAALQKTFEQNINNLEQARIRLESFQQDTTIKQEEFQILAREYSQAQIRYYLLAQRAQEVCGEDVATILYFYSNTANCPECEDQAFILTYLKRLFGERLLIFSFNSLLAEEEQTIQLLMNRYEINTFPSIVVNGELHEELVGRDHVLEELCQWYDEELAACDTSD